MTAAVSFLQAPNLFFLFLGLLPLILHLLSRRRWRVIRWAAMEFLLRAMRKQRRRLRLENLFLILLRTAAIVTLVVACARPFTQEQSLPLARATGSSTILALDASYSMAYQERGESVLRRAVELAKGRVRGLTATDRLVIVRAADVPEVLFDDHVTTDARLRALEFLEMVEVGATPLDVRALLAQLRRSVDELAEDRLPVRIEIFTDLQARDWFARGRQPEPQIREGMAALKERSARFQIVDLAGPYRTNVGVVDLRLDRTLLAVDVPVTFQATVHNWSAEEKIGLAVDLLVDDHQVQGRSLDLGGGTSQAVTFRHVFRDAGVHAATVEVRSDGLPVDNRRFLAVNVRTGVTLLLVDGEDAVDARERETFYLEAALAPRDDPGMESLSPFRIETVPARGLTAQALEGKDAVVFANVNRITIGGALREFLARGGAVLFFLGANVDPDFYNQELFASPNGLMPLALKGLAGDPNFAYSVTMEPTALDHPVMRFFVDRDDVRLDSAPVMRWYRTEAGEGARVLASYRDVDGTPAIVEAAAGQGKVIVVTTTADEQWTNFPKSLDFVPLVHELLSYMVSPRIAERNLLVGWPFRRLYPAVAYAAEVSVRSPRGNVTRTSLRRLGEGAEGDFELVYERTEAPGIFTVELSRRRSLDELLADRYPERDAFAVNVAGEEGDMTATNEAGLRAAYGEAAPPVVVPAESGGETAATGPVRQDLWRPLLIVMLLFFVVEAVCAALVGRRQR
jgi:hypothetical protein